MKEKVYQASLYPDFKLTAENCGTEPIHRPLAIQGHGYLIAFDRTIPGHLLAVSKGVAQLLGVPMDELWKTPVEQWKKKVLVDTYKELMGSGSWDPTGPDPVMEIEGKSYNLVRHSHKERQFIEIEPQLNSHVNHLSSYKAISMVTEPLNAIKDLNELYARVASLYKNVSGYDRVMVYQFDHDHHGHVVGEACESHLEPYLGLHYPATDIPKMARDLFLLNKSRMIYDVYLENHRLHFNPHLEGDIPHLDLTYSQLRASSPMHIKYLKNMGVTASLTLAVIIENRLWGLIACHHYTPHFTSYEMRKTAELIADIFSKRIVEITQKQYLEKISHYYDLATDFLENIHFSSDISVQLTDKRPDLTKLCESDGFAAVTANAGMYTYGAAPDKDTLIQIKDWLTKENAKDIYVTDHLEKDMPSGIVIPESIGGLLSICISNWDDTYLMWFRKAQIQTSHWGGNPNKPLEVEYLESGEVLLSPRKSFEKWKVQVDVKSNPWDKINEDTARRLMKGLLSKEVEKARVVKDDYEQLTFVASHDLQEPLRTVTNYLKLFSKKLVDHENDELHHYMHRINMATGRMKKLIKDMLDYSQLGVNRKKEWVTVSEILAEIMEDMDLLINETKCTVDIGNLPNIKADRTEITQLFRELIRNGIKYRKKGTSPVIHIKADHAGHHWIFSVKDNGIGIDEMHFDRIFLLFQRLHGKEEYDGTGIGLSYCKKLIDHLNGKLWVTSRLGEGSTFLFSLHESLVKTNEEETQINLTY